MGVETMRSVTVGVKKLILNKTQINLDEYEKRYQTINFYRWQCCFSYTQALADLNR
jgi:hypothetical protein